MVMVSQIVHSLLIPSGEYVSHIFLLAKRSAVCECECERETQRYLFLRRHVVEFTKACDRIAHYCRISAPSLDIGHIRF